MFINFPRRRASVTYDIQPSAEGWRVGCKDILGPPYSRQSDAIKDTLFIASQLEASGERVTVRVLELDGPRQVWRELDQRDAHLYR
jgi:hypothetical protein